MGIDVNEMLGDLNPNDIKLLEICKDKFMPVSEIAKRLGIDRKNVYARLDKLESLKLISVVRGNKGKTLIKTISKKVLADIEKTKLSILKQISDKGGVISLEEYNSLPNNAEDSEEWRNIFIASNSMLYNLENPLVKQNVQITEEGKNFIKNKSKN